jgi:Protein of unknown function (DUF2924)
MDPTVVAAVEKLRGLSVAALQSKYRELLGEESKSSNKRFLFRRIAWQLQARAEGDLSERARRRAAAIAQDSDLRTRAPRAFTNPRPEATAGSTTGFTGPQRDYRLPKPGTLLMRRFEGREVLVKVLDRGFEYQSRQYRSLSAIAREVTGTRWNGLLFFGLTERRHG